MTSLRTCNKGQHKSFGPEALVAPWKDDARCVQVNGGDCRLKTLTVAGGYGVHIDTCNYFEWSGGGNSGKTKKYSLFAGNALIGLAQSVHLSDLSFPWPSDNEASLRFMGCDDVLIENCDVGSIHHMPKHLKENQQFRHIRHLKIVGGSLCWATVFGCLGPGEASEASLKVYHADAKAHRLVAELIDVDIIGDVRVTGQSDVTFRRCNFIKPDPRGRGGKNAVSLTTFQTNVGTLKPTARLISCVKGSGWKSLGGPGVVVV